MTILGARLYIPALIHNNWEGYEVTSHVAVLFPRELQPVLFSQVINSPHACQTVWLVINWIIASSQVLKPQCHTVAIHLALWVVNLWLLIALLELAVGLPGGISLSLPLVMWLPLGLVPACILPLPAVLPWPLACGIALHLPLDIVSMLLCRWANSLIWQAVDTELFCAVLALLTIATAVALCTTAVVPLWTTAIAIALRATTAVALCSGAVVPLGSITTTVARCRTNAVGIPITAIWC